MKVLFGFLGFTLLVMQYQLWLGDDSIRALNLLDVDLTAQRDTNAALIERNLLLEVEVLDLKNGTEAVEERARSELGLIGEGETFYLIVED